jgi:hypothetical protein
MKLFIFEEMIHEDHELAHAGPKGGLAVRSDAPMATPVESNVMFAGKVA